MRVNAILVLTVLVMNASANEWTPPENPDLQEILNEAQADARRGKYELALAKHVWFHENALKYSPAMTGVRLSFALGYWHELGKVYPPALEKLKEIREETKKRIMADDGKHVSFEDFHDLASLNRELGEESETVKVFKFVDEKNPKAAERVFGISEPALIKAKEYVLCGKYLWPEVSVSRALDIFKLDTELKVEPQFAEVMKKSRDRRFIENGATLVALLVINDRKAEAEQTAAKLKTVEADADFHEKLAAALDKALAGELPAARQ